MKKLLASLSTNNSTTGVFSPISPVQGNFSNNSAYVDTEFRKEVFTLNGLKYEYSGTVIVGGSVPHGTGRLCFPNGVCYEGEFHMGKRSGSGTVYTMGTVTEQEPKKKPPRKLSISSRNAPPPKTEKYAGQWSIMGLWSDNCPRADSKCKVKCEKYEYVGYLELDKSKVESIFELLNLSDFKKNGEGELHNGAERYIGLFKDDMKHGYGIQTYKNKDRYFGGWYCDKLHGFGTYMYNDGTTFQGIFQNGMAKGNGTLYWPNGDSMTGEWVGSQVKNGIFSKGECNACQKVILYRMSDAIREGLRSINDYYYFDIERQKVDRVSNALKWRQYKVLNEIDFKSEQEFFGEVFVRKLYSLESFEECLNTLLTANSNSTLNNNRRWFVSSSISFFLTFFETNYSVTLLSGANNGRILDQNIVINDAKADIESFIVFLQNEVWNFFDYLITTHTNTSQNLKTNCKSSCMTIIREFVHEKVANTWFALYNKTYQDKDILANQKLDVLRNTLTLDMLGIPKEFHPPVLDPSSTDVDNTTNPEPYKDAISILNELDRKETVKEKIHVLNTCFRSFVNEMARYRAAHRLLGRNKTTGNLTAALMNSMSTLSKEYEIEKRWEPAADDYTGIALYVFMKSSVRNHNAQYHFINDYSEGFQAVGAVQLYEGVLKYIDDLDPALHSKNGALISAYSLSVSLEDAFRLVRGASRANAADFSWLPHLLAFLSLETSRYYHNLRMNTVKTENNNDEQKGDQAIVSLEIPDNVFMNLKDRLIKQRELVEKTLTYAERLGFKVVYDKEENNTVFVEIGDETLPAHVYNELSILSSKLVYGPSLKDKRFKRTDSTLKRIMT